MKKIIVSLTFMLCILSAGMSVCAYSVTFEPVTFPVTINGQNFTGIDSEYPIYLYNDVVYFPLEQNYAGFLGLRTDDYIRHRYDPNKVYRFIGVEDKENPIEPKIIPCEAEKPSGAVGETEVPYDIALNAVVDADFFDNSAEEYPFVDVEGITYIPLSWRMVIDEFGWVYSFDSENGLMLDTSDPFVPYMDSDVIGNTMQIMGYERFVYSDDYYVGYKTIWLDPDKNMEFRVRKRGGDEITYSFNILEQFGIRMSYGYRPAEYRFAESDDERYARIDGNIFTIVYGKFFLPNLTCYRIKINLDTGEMLSVEEIDNPL